LSGPSASMIDLRSCQFVRRADFRPDSAAEDVSLLCRNPCSCPVKHSNKSRPPTAAVHKGSALDPIGLPARYQSRRSRCSLSKPLKVRKPLPWTLLLRHGNDSRVTSKRLSLIGHRSSHGGVQAHCSLCVISLKRGRCRSHDRVLN